MSFSFEYWPTEFRYITQTFGANPDYYRQFNLPGHEGIDLRAAEGSRIFAVTAGTVIRAHSSASTHNYGLHVRLRHENGYETTYAHLSRIAVELNQQVKAGQVIGFAGNTGNSFGAHLHLTLYREGAAEDGWPNNIIDPTLYLLPLMGWRPPVGAMLQGWMLRPSLVIEGELAQVVSDGAQIWVGREQSYLVPGGTIVSLTEHASGNYVLVRVARASVGLTDDDPSPPPRPPQPTISTIDGYAFVDYLTLSSDVAIVATQGINLRTEPNRDSDNIGLVRGGAELDIITPSESDYVYVRANREDFIGAVDLPYLPKAQLEQGLSYLGWVEQRRLSADSGYVTVRQRFGANLLQNPSAASPIIGLVKGFATVLIVDEPEDGYVPIHVAADDLLNADGEVAIAKPPHNPIGVTPIAPPKPIHDTTPGWVLSTEVGSIDGEGFVSAFGATLRNQPRRDAATLGFVPPNGNVIILGEQQGEFTPIRVDDTLLRPPQPEPIDPVPRGNARFGLFVSAESQIPPTAIEQCRAARPTLIGLLATTEPDAVSSLASQHTDAQFVVRATMPFGAAAVSAEQFASETLPDVQRTLALLDGRDVVVEMHRQPNVTTQGWGASWRNGGEFAVWLNEVIVRYRNALSGATLIYPGLSPGASIRGLRQDHIEFLEASRSAVKAADGLGMQLHWSDALSLGQALRLLDDGLTRFRDVPVWVTEAVNNSRTIRSNHRANQYLDAWRQMQDRPSVRGVVFYVVHAIDPALRHIVWNGTDIGPIVGRR